MAHKLDLYRQQILDFKAEGETVRSIASKLSDLSGEKIASSTVQHFLKQGNVNGESKTSPEISKAPSVERMDNVEILLADIKARLTHIEQAICFVDVKIASGARIRVHYTSLSELTAKDFEKYEEFGNSLVWMLYKTHKTCREILQSCWRFYERLRAR